LAGKGSTGKGATLVGPTPGETYSALADAVRFLVRRTEPGSPPNVIVTLRSLLRVSAMLL
jgi:hypothetical protein